MDRRDVEMRWGERPGERAERRRWVMDGVDDGWREREQQRQRVTWRALMPLILMLTIIRSSAPRHGRGRQPPPGFGSDDHAIGHYSRSPHTVSVLRHNSSASHQGKVSLSGFEMKHGGGERGINERARVGAGRASPGGLWHRTREAGGVVGEPMTFGEEWEDEAAGRSTPSIANEDAEEEDENDDEGDYDGDREMYDGDFGEEGEEEEDETQFPFRLTGLFRGVWEVKGRSELKGAAAKFENTKGTVVMQVISHLPGREMRESKSSTRAGKGSKGYRTLSYGKEVGLMRVDMVMRDGEYSSSRDLHSYMQGMYRRETGHLSLWSVCYTPGCGMLLGGLGFTPPREDGANSSHGGLTVAALDREGRFRAGLGKARTRHVEDAGGETGGGRSGRGEKCDLKLHLQVGHQRVVRSQMVEEEAGEQDMSPLARAPRGSMPRFEPTTIGGNGTSSTCGFKISINTTLVGLHEYRDKAVRYSVMLTVASFAQVLLLVRQIEYSTTRNTAAHVSIIGIGYQAMLDAYMCLIHVTTGILVESIFSAFITAAFFKFIIFSVFELRYLLIIFKARNPRAFQEGWDAMRQALSQFYARFYGALLIGIIAIYQLRNNPAALILLLYSFWVPQIIYNAAMGHRRPMLPIYIAGMSAARLVFPLYLLGCPSNFFHNQPSLPLALLCVAWVGGQALVLICQRMWGPRFFVPARVLPKSYDYYRSMPPLDGADCAICMAAVGPGGARGDADGDRVTTPCDHAFHLGCFKTWIQIKLECPVCRRAVPEMEDEVDDD